MYVYVNLISLSLSYVVVLLCKFVYIERDVYLHRELHFMRDDDDEVAAAYDYNSLITSLLNHTLKKNSHEYPYEVMKKNRQN